MSTLRIQERFVSIQGEGLLAGQPSTFVRVTGCPLRCAWCDTPRTSWAPEGEHESVRALVDWCAAGPRHVVITGGEPLLFRGVARLASMLRERDHHVTVETSGSVWLDGLEADLVSIAPKLAHSTPTDRAAAMGRPDLAMIHDRARVNVDVLRRLVDAYDWQVKFVVRANGSAELAADVTESERILAAIGIEPDQRDRVMLVPEGVEAEAMREGYRRLVDVCRDTGMRIGLRLHIDLFGHTSGT